MNNELDELETAFAQYCDKMRLKTTVEAEALEIQQKLDEKLQESQAIYTEARSVVAGVLAKMHISVDGGFVVPGLLRLSPDQMVTAIGEDRLWVSQHDGVHIFEPADEDGNRRCNICGRYIRWDKVEIGIVPEKIPPMP